MENLKKFLSILLCVTLIIVLLPIIILIALYELTPSRRRKLFELQSEIIGILARQGETECGKLRCQLKTEKKLRFSPATFYETMSLLVEKGWVKSREETIDDKAYPLFKAYYKLTEQGRQVRNRRSAWESLRGLKGRLISGLTPA